MKHDRNAVSYSRLVDICTGFGGNYNPGRQTLQLKAMRALLTEAQSSLHNVSQKKDAFDRKTNERVKAFAGLEIMANRVVRIMEALQIPRATINDARYYTRLIAGRRATPKSPIQAEGNENPLVYRSVSQLSYDDRALNLLRFAQMVQDLPTYKTNVVELQAQTIMDKAVQLQNLNEEVYKARLELTDARLHRNRILYGSIDGLVPNGMAIKHFIRALFGTRSGEAARLKEVSFTKQKVR